jgi:hypothetical protein
VGESTSPFIAYRAGSIERAQRHARAAEYRSNGAAARLDIAPSA